MVADVLIIGGALCAYIVCGVVMFLGWGIPVYAMLIAGGYLYSCSSILVCIAIAYGYYSGKYVRSILRTVGHVIYMVGIIGTIIYWTWFCVFPPPSPDSYVNVFVLGVTVNFIPILCLACIVCCCKNKN